MLQFFTTNFHYKSLYREDLWEKIMTCPRNFFNVITCSKKFLHYKYFLDMLLK